MYDVAANDGNGQQIANFVHAAPVLETCFGETDREVYSAGLDQQVKLLDLETQQERVLGACDEAVRNVVWNRDTSMALFPMSILSC